MKRLTTNSISAASRTLISLGSYCFVFVFRKLLRKLNREGGIMLPSKNHNSLVWQGWSETQRRKWGLAYVMIVAPRWNPHSIQHHVGPIKVDGRIRIRLETARESAEQWIISFYRLGKEAYTLTSMEFINYGEWHEVAVDSGTYAVFLRYYNCRRIGRCPEMIIDGALRVAECSTEPEIDNYAAFMQSLANHRSAFYRFLHYYVLSSLQWYDRLPIPFVRKAYLPFGNPGTIFYYGLVNQGEILQISWSQSLMHKAGIYLVVLDNCGFPIFWLTLEGSGFLSDEIPRRGTYLVRIVYHDLSEYKASIPKQELCNTSVKQGKYRILKIVDGCSRLNIERKSRFSRDGNREVED